MSDLLSSPVALWAFCAGVFLAAGVVKGVVGLGLPTLAMALLALAMTPARAAALLILPSLVTNVWQMLPRRTLGALLRRLGPMQVGVFAGTLLASWRLGAPAGAWAALALGSGAGQIIRHANVPVLTIRGPGKAG